VSGRVSPWPLVFCPLREVGHGGGRLERASGAARDGAEYAQHVPRGWSGAGRTRKSWPASLSSLQRALPPATPAGPPDMASTDVRGRLNIFHNFLAQQQRAMGRHRPPHGPMWVHGPSAGHRADPRLQLVLVRSTLLRAPSAYIPFLPLLPPFSSRHAHHKPLRSLRLPHLS
jgi:hypothetical protein